jgi:hypothetical protein
MIFAIIINITMDKIIIKKWVKIIPDDKLIEFSNYIRKDNFKLISNILLDTDKNDKGIKKRKTLIKFESLIDNDDFTRKTEWIYLFTINDKIVKIGGTRTGIKGRISSYLCGHHIEERGKSGDCSKTNGYIYNTFHYYLMKGYKINMYGYELPLNEIIIKIFDKEIKIIPQTYHAYESTFIEDYKNNYGEYPYLCDKCDPTYK